ncbi:hypothetical protein [Yersinia wautersii]|uniref:Uncharacterized protein n=2 Tax=Yersinia wautersii TaxID=1341643 RepID=A0ABP1ZCT5_9GAMM|nr:hypothetical protein [Yersinia wautersii]CRG50529.1 Uncharacterised protein [Yersinia wautersii]
MTLINLKDNSLKNTKAILFYSNELIVIDMDFSNQEQRMSFLRNNEYWQNVNDKEIIHGDIDTGLFIGEMLINEKLYIFKLNTDEN